MAHPNLPPEPVPQADGHHMPPRTVVAPLSDDDELIFVHLDDAPDGYTRRLLDRIDAGEYPDNVEPPHPGDPRYS